MEKIERISMLALKELGYGEGYQAIGAMHRREMTVRTKNLQKSVKARARNS
jgi:hypothetical protein